MALIVKPSLNLNPATRHHNSHHHFVPVFTFLRPLSGAHRRKSLLFLIAAPDKPAAACSCKSGRTILWSDVQVQNRRKRTSPWSSLDLATSGVVLSMHILFLFAPFTFSWGALWTAVVLYFITGLLGITLSFHRNLAHRSFKLPKWLEYTFAYCGVQALQGNPMDWVRTHRDHHQFCDSDRDPHSPIEGLWFSHMSWLFDTASIIQRCGGIDNVGDLAKQPVKRDA